jgi:2-aminoadipate transaminase
MPDSRSDSGSSFFAYARRAQALRPSAVREILKVTAQPDVISFAGGLPAPELFPVEAMRAAADAVLRTDGRAALQYGVTEGHPPLREWIAAHLAESVGLRAGADELLVTHGSQQGLDLVARVLLDPGDIVLTENPAYLGALQVFQAYEAEPVGLACDDAGLVPAALREWLARAPRRPKLLYLIPNYQNPTGVRLAAARRAEIAEIAALHRLPILEDDPYGRLRYSGEEAPALASLGGGDATIYLGSTSKVLAPGLRVAWLHTRDAGLRAKLTVAKQASDLHTSSFTQRLVASYLSQPGQFEAQLGRLREVYGRRRDLMLAALARELPEGCSWTKPEGGLFLWVTLPEGWNATELFAEAAAAKVAFVPGDSFWVGEPRRNTLRLNFSNASESAIETGTARLGAILRARAARG